MILLDTHIWVWWVDGNPRLTAAQRKHVEIHENATAIHAALFQPALVPL